MTRSVAWGLPDCALTPAVSRSLDLGLGVQLGMDQEAVSKVLGKADKSKTNLVLWSYTLEDKEKRCESDVTLTVVLEANRVVVIDVAQVTSC